MEIPETVDGFLQADGTLVLNQKLNLPPGQVVVTVQPAASVASRRSLADVIDEIRRDQAARGFQGRTAGEIEAVLREGEADYEQRMQALRISAS